MKNTRLVITGLMNQAPLEAERGEFVGHHRHHRGVREASCKRHLRKPLKDVSESDSDGKEVSGEEQRRGQHK